MTKGRKQRRLSYEILGLIGVSAFFAFLLLLILIGTGEGIVQGYCFRNDIVMTEFAWLEADRWIWSVSSVIAAISFSVLLLLLLNERMVYIRTITEGIHALRLGETDVSLPLEGRNELTELADSINFLSETQRKLREKEQALSREKEQFLRTLSHDIRTPLTSILAYSEFLTADDNISAEQNAQLQMIRRKAEQIRDLTQLLLDGDKRNPEYFEDTLLLMKQLAAGFEEELEDGFDVRTDLSGCLSFSGTFDVQELRRIFDNLSSNVQKYADPHQPVCLRIRADRKGLSICQENGIAPTPAERDSYRLGLNSIRRIAQNYGGRVEIRKDEAHFEITILLADVL